MAVVADDTVLVNQVPLDAQATASSTAATRAPASA
jgi:hypothetical protein